MHRLQILANPAARVGRDHRFVNGRLPRLVSLGVIAVVLTSSQAVWADPPVVTQYNSSAILTNKGQQSLVVTQDDPDTKANVRTHFGFHPPQTLDPDQFVKNFGNNTVSENPITHHYTKDEDHKTKGSATYELAIANVTGTTPLGETFLAGKVLTASVTAAIDAGQNPIPTDVYIIAHLRDPVPYSDTSPLAAFGFVPEGVDVGYSLLAGTAFPSVLSLDPLVAGGIPDQLSMKFTARVAPGVVSDPDVFWDDALTGAIDLYSVTLTIDINHVVDAQITLGASTSDFTLDYVGVATAEAMIESAFVGGALTMDLDNIFSVGFIPTGGVSEFTAGIQSEVNNAALETPEPGSLVLALTGASGVAAIALRRRRERKRRRANAGYTAPTRSHLRPADSAATRVTVNHADQTP